MRNNGLEAAPRLTLQAAGRSWKSRVGLRALDLVIESGERVLLAGPSGGGKTTLLRMMAGSVCPTTGHVFVGDRDMSAMSSRGLRVHRRNVGLIPQQHFVVPQLLVHHNVLMGMLPHWSWPRVFAARLFRLERTRVGKSLDRLGLGNYQWEYAGNLSTGQQQRVAVARALIARPNIVLADEPTASLDPQTAKQVLNFIARECEYRRSTLVLCTHWISLMRNYADRFVGIRDGRVVLDVPMQVVGSAAIHSLYAGSSELK